VPPWLLALGEFKRAGRCSSKWQAAKPPNGLSARIACVIFMFFFCLFFAPPEADFPLSGTHSVRHSCCYLVDISYVENSTTFQVTKFSGEYILSHSHPSRPHNHQTKVLDEQLFRTNGKRRGRGRKELPRFSAAACLLLKQRRRRSIPPKHPQGQEPDSLVISRQQTHVRGKHVGWGEGGPWIS